MSIWGSVWCLYFVELVRILEYSGVNCDHVTEGDFGVLPEIIRVCPEQGLCVAVCLVKGELVFSLGSCVALGASKIWLAVCVYVLSVCLC